MDGKKPTPLPINAFNTAELRVIFDLLSNQSIVFPAAKGNASNGVLNKVAHALGEKIDKDPPAAA